MRTKSSRLWGSTADEATRMEDYARILDFLPQGHPDQSKFHREPLAYALGVHEFKLFELVPKEGVTLSVGQRVYIGKEDDVGDSRGAEEGSVQVVPGSRSARAECPPP